MSSNYYTWTFHNVFPYCRGALNMAIFLSVGVRKTNVWLQCKHIKLEEHFFTITSLWNHAAAALSPGHTIKSPWGAAWSLCPTACSWTPRWAIYFRASIPYVYWSVAPCHIAALPPRDRKASQGPNTSSLKLQGQELFRKELELTAASELATFAPWTSVEECWPRQMVSVPQLLSTHSCLANPLEPESCSSQGQFLQVSWWRRANIQMYDTIILLDVHDEVSGWLSHNGKSTIQINN